MSIEKLLIPPKKCLRRDGRFRWPAQAALASARTADVLPLKQLGGNLKRLDVAARVVRNAFGPAELRIRRESNDKGPEAYRLRVAPDSVEVFAAGDAGAYYAVQTLRELIAQHGRSLPACEIHDWPDFHRRGVYYDCSRGKVPKLSTLKALVEQLARWKVNELQLYVENVFTFHRHPKIGRGYSPFSPEEILALQDHCRKHHVRFVGSLASFGHMEKTLALPEYSHLGELPDFRGYPGGTTLCPIDPGSIRLLSELYEEFVPLFEAEDFNVCGDEPWELGKGRSKRRADRVGVGRVYIEFLSKIHRLCERHGKRMNAWSDIVLKHPQTLKDLPPDVVMLNWEYDPHGERIGRTKEITDARLPLVVCPGTNAWNSHGCRLKMGMRNIANFAEEGAKRGAEGLLNTDWGDNGHRNMLAVSLHNFAWGGAVGWNRRGADERGFTERFVRHTFGANPTLARAISTLGNAAEALGQKDGNLSVLSAFFLAPIRELAPEQWKRGHLEHAVRQGDLSRHYRALSKLRWPDAKSRPDDFTAATMQEYALATRLDMAACLRAMILKDIWAGKSPSAAQVRKASAETVELVNELKRVWRLQNKPSRLRDIVAGLRVHLREYREMSK